MTMSKIYQIASDSLFTKSALRLEKALMEDTEARLLGDSLILVLELIVLRKHSYRCRITTMYK